MAAEAAAVAEAVVVIVFLFLILFFLVVVLAATEVGAVVTAVEVGAVVVVVRWLPAAAAKVVVDASGYLARMEATMGVKAPSLFRLASATTLAVETVKPAENCDGKEDKLPRASSVLAAAGLSIIDDGNGVDVMKGGDVTLFCGVVTSHTHIFHSYVECYGVFT